MSMILIAAGMFLLGFLSGFLIMGLAAGMGRADPDRTGRPFGRES